MTDKELKKLKDDLWHAADMLRAGAHIAANKYGQPILGLIFLRYADILFKQHHDEIMAEYEKYKGTRMEKDIKSIAVEKCGFFLPECAYYDFINNAPRESKAREVCNAGDRGREPQDGRRSAQGGLRSACPRRRA